MLLINFIEKKYKISFKVFSIDESLILKPI